MKQTDKRHVINAVAIATIEQAQTIAAEREIMGEREVKLGRVTDVARSVSVTPRALQIAFRRHPGGTPRTYLRNARLDLAHHTLAADTTNRLKLSSVAQDHGFANASKFARRFRERFGRNPSRIARGRTS